MPSTTRASTAQHKAGVAKYHQSQHSTTRGRSCQAPQEPAHYNTKQELPSTTRASTAQHEAGAAKYHQSQHSTTRGRSCQAPPEPAQHNTRQELPGTTRVRIAHVNLILFVHITYICSGYIFSLMCTNLALKNNRKQHSVQYN